MLPAFSLPRAALGVIAEVMKYRDVVRMLEKDGWYLKRQGKGSHRIYRHPEKPGMVPILRSFDEQACDDKVSGNF